MTIATPVHQPSVTPNRPRAWKPVLAGCIFVAVSVACTGGSQAPTVVAGTEPQAEPAGIDDVTLVQTANGVDYGWVPVEDSDSPDSPAVDFVTRTSGGSWEVVSRLNSRPTAIAVAENGSLAMVLQSSPHLDEVLVGGVRVTGELPEFPGDSPLSWQDAAPNGAQRLVYRGSEHDGVERSVWIVQSGDSWAVSPIGELCHALSDLSEHTVRYQGSEAHVAFHEDLNGDGDKEYILTVKDSCGTGGCDTPILLACGPLTGGYRVIGNPEAFGDISVMDTQTNGWRDIVFESRGEGGPVETKYDYPSEVYGPLP